MISWNEKEDPFLFYLVFFHDICADGWANSFYFENTTKSLRYSVSLIEKVEGRAIFFFSIWPAYLVIN